MTVGILALVVLVVVVAAGSLVRPVRNWIATRGGGLPKPSDNH